MTKQKSTKRALLLSALSLIMCVSMLVGSTFAWFTDSVTSGKNKIIAGNLDVELKYAKVVDGQLTTFETVQGKENIFDPDALWEPGRVEVVYLEVSNLGTLQLKYQLGVNVSKETPGVNVAGEEFKLSDHLVFKAVEMPNGLTTYTDRQAAQLAAGTEKGLKDYNGTTTPLEAGGTDYVALIVYMPETVGNEANYRGDKVPTIELGINLYATQYTAESDSFGKDYDEDAIPVDVLATPETIDEILATVEAGTAIGLSEGYYDEIVLTQNDLTLTSANGEAVVGFLNLNAKDGATIDSLTFDQNGAKQTYTFKTGNTQAATDYIANITGDTNSPKAADGVVIKNCTFTNTNGVATAAASLYAPICFIEQGAATERCDSITVENCVFACNAHQYIVLNYMAEGNVVIKNNTFGSATFGTNHNTIQATGNAANWTIAGNSFNNWNVEKTAIGSSKQGSNTVTWTVTGNEFNHKDGAVIMALKTSYTAANSVVTVADNTVLGENGTIVTTGVNAENETVYGGHKIQLNDGVAMANTSEEMTDAINNGDTTIVLGTGVYILPDSAQGKTLTISGTGNPEDTLIATQDDGSYEGCDYSLDGATVVFENISINTDSTTYTGYARLKATYNNCIINGTYTLYDNSTFNNCTFNVSGDVYNIWTWGAPNATFKDCTFNCSGKAILLYGGANTVLTVTNCVFNDANDYADVNNKAAIEVGSDWSTDTKTIVATNCTVNGFDVTTKGPSTGSTLWGNKNGLSSSRLSVTIDSEKVCFDANTLKAANGSNITLAGTVDLGGTAGNYLTLNQDTTITGGSIKGAGWSGELNYAVNATAGNIVFDGVTFDMTEFTTVGWATWGISVNVNGTANVTFKNCTFKGNQCPIYQSGADSVITLENCKFDTTTAIQCEIYSGDFALGQDLIVKNCDFTGVADVLHIYDYDKNPTSEAIAQYLTDNGNIFTGTCKQTCQ